MYCEHCGNQIGDADVCLKCGHSVKKGNEKRELSIPSEYKPISMWGYFGYEILFAIPIIGFILLLVFAFGGTPNINVKNFARSYFCLLIIVVLLIIVFAVFVAGSSSYPSVPSWKY